MHRTGVLDTGNLEPPCIKTRGGATVLKVGGDKIYEWSEQKIF